MWIKWLVLLFTGLAGGIFVAGGVFALINSIGVIPRLADKSHTMKHIKTYESAIVFGGIWGNVISVFQPFFPVSVLGLWLFGTFSGIFVGCMATSLAEALNTSAVFSRRIRLHKGLGFTILCVGISKMLASMLFFYLRWYE